MKLPLNTKFCECSACGEIFTNVNNFDLHRTWVNLTKGTPKRPENRICVDPGTLVNKKGNARLRRNARGLWAGTGGIYKGPGGRDE